MGGGDEVVGSEKNKARWHKYLSETDSHCPKCQGCATGVGGRQAGFNVLCSLARGQIGRSVGQSEKVHWEVFFFFFFQLRTVNRCLLYSQWPLVENYVTGG